MPRTGKLELLPTPDELVTARRIIRELHYAIGFEEPVADRAGMRMWDSLVEGGRAIAVTTAYLGQVVDPAYAAAWEKMMEGDEE